MATEKMFGSNQQNQIKPTMPQIILNQPGADLINQLLDAALKGGGIANLVLVKNVIAVTNYRQAPPQEVVKEETKKPVGEEFTNKDKKC
jgi:hypothetical protein